MSTEQKPACAKCPFPKSERYCLAPQGKGPASCPSLRKKRLLESARDEYRELYSEFARQAAIQEGLGYDRSCCEYSSLKPVKPRIVEIVEFARRMRYKKLGFIFCAGTSGEAAIVQEILETNGFEVVSLLCKVGRMPKSELGVAPEDQLVCGAFESACNPIMQAMACNEAGVDFTILLGLCVGHDSMALKYLEAPATVFAVKDRLLAHNPLAAIYMYDSYYRYLKKPLP
jgi:uncharacterized metal-binding protein